MSKITTHVLDTVIGRPAGGIVVHLERVESGSSTVVGRSITDTDGRCRDLIEDAAQGVYRLVYQTAAYLESAGRTTIYPEIVITFACRGEAHYHLPLLLSDNSYTTYRGS